MDNQICATDWLESGSFLIAWADRVPSAIFPRRVPRGSWPVPDLPTIVPLIALVCWKPFPSGDTSKDAPSDGLSIAQGVLICVRVKVPYTPN